VTSFNLSKKKLASRYVGGDRDLCVMSDKQSMIQTKEKKKRLVRSSATLTKSVSLLVIPVHVIRKCCGQVLEHAIVGIRRNR
jgi:hypothetical protein